MPLRYAEGAAIVLLDNGIRPGCLAAQLALGYRKDCIYASRHQVRTDDSLSYLYACFVFVCVSGII